MSVSITTALLWAATISSGLMAGVYFAFSAFIMQAFGKIDATQAITAMNSINKVILRSLFMPIFFGSTIVSLVLIIFAFIHWDEPGAELIFLAGLIYFIGMFVCTILFNVPLNNSLATVNTNNDNAHQVWSHYLKTWTRWNHLRTISSLATCALCVWLLSIT